MRNFNIDIALHSHTELPPHQIGEIESFLRLAFPEEPDFGYDWAEPEKHLTARSEGQLTAHIGLVEREILVGGRRLLVGGVGNVATHPEWRHNGIAHVLVRVAGGALRKAGCAFAMLFCGAELAGYYEKCGYRRLEAPLFIRSEGRRLRIDEIKMALPLAGEEWPVGEIDLMGLPW